MDRRKSRKLTRERKKKRRLIKNILIFAVIAFIFIAAFFVMRFAEKAFEDEAPQEEDLLESEALKSDPSVKNRITESMETTESEELEQAPSNYQIQGVPHIYQNDDYPTACESVATVSVLQYLGYDITVNEFIDNYLTIGEVYKDENGELYGPSLDEAYVGNPYDNTGCSCNAPVILKALYAYFDELGIDENNTAYNFTGSGLKELCEKFICRDIPVIVWATINMAGYSSIVTWINADTAEEVDFYVMVHCLALTGYDEDYYYFMDSTKTESTTAYSRSAVEYAYEMLGMQAIVINP